MDAREVGRRRAGMIAGAVSHVEAFFFCEKPVNTSTSSRTDANGPRLGDSV